MGTERRSRACPRKYTIVTSFTLSAHNISVCGCLLTSQSSGVAVMVSGGWGLLMVCVQLVFLGLFFNIYFWLGWERVCLCVCMMVCPDTGLFWGWRRARRRSRRRKGDTERRGGAEGGLGHHTSHSESLEVTERMEVPVSTRSARLDTLVVGLAAVDGDSAELCVGQPGSASERMPLGPMAWCWSLRETESGACPDTAAAPPAPPSRLPPGARAARAAGSRAYHRLCSPASPSPRPVLRYRRPRLLSRRSAPAPAPGCSWGAAEPPLYRS